MAATIAAHWYQHENGSSCEDAPSRFPFLRLPYKRQNSGNSDNDNVAPKRPTSSKSNKSFYRPSTSRSTGPPQRAAKRRSMSVHSVTAPPQMASTPAPKSRGAYWRKKLGVHFIPPLAYYGWGSPDEVKRVAKQSKPVTSVPPNVRTATNDDDLIAEAEADDMILLTEMRAPSALGGLTLVESRDDDYDIDQWPLTDHLR